MRLTEAEREALRGWWCEGSTPEVLAAMDAAVEAILAARLAKVEALAEQLDTWPDYLATEYDRGRVDQRHADALDLRAALDADMPDEGRR